MKITLPRRRWEVYRTVPASWSAWKAPGDCTYRMCWRHSTAQATADNGNQTLRNDRTDENFAVFRVRKNP